MPGLTRSNLREVRNPILALPAMHAILALPEPHLASVRALFLDLRRHCIAKAEESQRKCKWMMFAYWRVAAVYVGHIAKVMTPRAAALLGDGPPHPLSLYVERARAAGRPPVSVE